MIYLVDYVNLMGEFGTLVILRIKIMVLVNIMVESAMLIGGEI